MNNQKQLIAIILISVACFLAWGFVVPAISSLSDLRSAVTGRQQLLNDRTALITKIGTLETEYESKSQDAERLQQIVPAKISLAELISSIDSLLTKNGMNPAEQLSFPTQGSAVITQDNFVRIPIVMKIDGSYDQIYAMLKDIENNLRLIDIEKIHIEPKDTKNFDVLTATINATAYSLK